MGIADGARYISFDCYGTLINFQMTRTIKEVWGSRLPAEKADAFIELASAYRFDEVLGDWKPYRQVIRDATERAAHFAGVPYRDADGDALYEAIGTWGPHPGVVEGLRALASRYPLVILSNAADDQIPANVARLGAPFHKVLTAEQARAYKPRLAAFEFMFEALGCRPEEIIHVSSSPEYDLRPAAVLGIGTRVLLDRGYEGPQPWLNHHTVAGLGELAALLGITAPAAGRA